MFINMNKHTKKFTKTEKEILDFLFKYPTASFRGRALAVKIKRPVSGVIKSARSLESQNLVKISKDFTLSIRLNRDNKETFILKRINNLKSLYQSGLVYYLSDKFPGSTIIIFGSYSYGEDTEESDIDIAIIGYSEKHLDELARYSDKLKREVQLHFFKDIKSVHKNLKENIVNGIVLEGTIKL